MHNLGTFKENSFTLKEKSKKGEIKQKGVLINYRELHYIYYRKTPLPGTRIKFIPYTLLRTLYYVHFIT